MSEGHARPWFQFTTRGIFVATFSSAVFAMAVVLYGRLWYRELVAFDIEFLAYLFVACLMFVSIPAAIGGLFGRALSGAALGIILYALSVGWILLAVVIWGI